MAQTDLDALYEAAKAEGQLTTIALPHDWCGYGDVIDGFKAKYPGITVNELNPDAGSADEIEAIKANKGNTGPQAPDVIDVGLSLRPVGQGRRPDPALQGLDLGHDPGLGQGRRRLLVRRLLRRAVVPREQRPRRHRRRPPGPTCRSPNTPTRSPSPVIRAPPTRPSRPSTAPVSPTGAAADADAGCNAGLDFFADLNEAGNFVPVIGKAASVAQGTTPIVVAWDYNALAWRDGFAGNPAAEVVVPTDSVVAGVYVQAIWPTRRTRTPPSSGWNTSTPTKVSSAGWPATATRSASTTSPPRARSRRICSTSCRRRRLRQGRVPDARRAGCRQGRHHHASGTPSSAPTSSNG